MKLYEQVFKNKISPSLFFFNILLNGFMKNKQFQIAKEIYYEMKSYGMHLNEYNVYISI
jgi:pentatricopeptide repeat protein